MDGLIIGLAIYGILHIIARCVYFEQNKDLRGKIETILYDILLANRSDDSVQASIRRAGRRLP